MKILHVLNIPFVIPYMLGDQISFMESNGFEIHIACSDGNKLDLYSKTWRFKLLKINISRRIDPINDLIAIYAICKYIRRNKIDIIVGHTPKGGVIAMIAGFVTKIEKRIYFRHGLVYETSFGFKRKLLIWMEKLTSFFSSLTLCVSNSVFVESLNNGLSNISKTRLLKKGTCNGIDAMSKFNPAFINLTEQSLLRSKLSIGPLDRVVGYVGRLSKDKGITELVDAWKIIKTNNSNVKLLLCGPIDERDPICNSCLNQINIDDSIIFCGEIDSTQLYYSIFSFFILPSFREGFPTVVLEASSMNLAVITTKKTGCIDSILENITGIFTDITDIGIADSIQFYLNNPEISTLHGLNGRDFIMDNYLQESIWDEIIKTYKI